MGKSIVILGAGLAGIQVTHRLLKHTLKGLNEDYKVVLVSTTDHFFWNNASVRAIVPGQIPDEEIYASIPEGLKQYGESVRFILGSATALNSSSKTVTVKSEKGEEKLSYDQLVIATGSRTAGAAPWKSSLKGHQADLKLLHETQEAVKNAKSIVVGGGGPTGVEAAAEIAFEYGKTKRVILITSSPTILSQPPAMPDSAISAAVKELTKLGVEVQTSTTILSTNKNPRGKTVVKTKSTEKGEDTIEVDLYLSSVGTVKNGEWLPKELKNEKGEVIVDEFLRVKTIQDVWAAGDMSSLQPDSTMYAAAQAETLAKNLDLVLNGKSPVAYIPDPTPKGAVSLGRSKGTGRFGNWRIPSIVVWAAKGRTLGRQYMQGAVTGSAY